MIGPPPGRQIDSASLDVLLAAALCCILLGLAWLQFRWIGQGSQAEHDRLERNLTSSSVRFAQGFDSELERMISLLVGGGGPSLAEADNRVFQSRLSAWRNTTRYPSLVKAVYLADDAALPDELRPLTQLLPEGHQPPPGAPPPPVMVDAKVPALALPLPGPGSSSPGGPLKGGGAVPRGLVVELDLNFIREIMLPELAARELGGDYLVRITETQPPETVIYQSGQQEDATLAPAQTAAKFPLLNLHLGPPPEDRRGPRFDPSRDPSGKAPPPDKAPHPGKGPPKGKGLPPGVGAWTMTVQFASGPPEAAVNRMRLRNLAVSFGMLVLVGIAGVVLVLSTRRVRRLAQQQMEFVAGVTHELRTPLSVISSASQNLADGVTTAPDQVKRYGSVIRDQSARLTGMVEQVLRFAGMSSDRYEMHWQTVELGPVIEQAVADCVPDFLRTGAQVERQIDPELPKVEGDPTALGQCIRNLLENAAIHGSRNGLASMVPALVKIRAAKTEEGVEIRVEDNGPGIDSGALPHLFEPFYRGPRAVEDQVHGTGLGLSLVKHIMDAHGGAIEVHSGVGEGTCFTLKLPVRTN